MSRAASSLLALFIITTPMVAHADSYTAFRNFRQVDPTGRYYLVARKNGGPRDPGSGTPITFEIAERKPGSPPLEAAEDQLRDLWDVAANPEVKIRDGDLVLGKGSLERCPGRILISSTGMGFVGLDVRGYNYGSLRSGDALVVVARDGTVRHRKDLIDLFNEAEVKRFFRSAGGIWWCGGGWIDEARKEVVVVGSRMGPGMRGITRLFRVVSLETGEVRDSTTELILTALAERNRGAMVLALSLAAELRLVAAKPDLSNILADESLGIMDRLGAAVALGAVGDRRGGDLMKKVANEDAPGRSFAIGHLPDVIGDEAGPILCDLVRRFGKDASYDAWQAMHRVSAAAAVPPLRKLLAEGNPAFTDFAVESLGNQGQGASPAVPDLIKLLETEPKTEKPLWTQELAALALGRIGPDAGEALPSLIRLAEKHAPAEWDKAKTVQPEPRDVGSGRVEYSRDCFVDAICKIRRK
jgi:hypothetical protein